MLLATVLLIVYFSLGSCLLYDGSPKLLTSEGISSDLDALMFLYDELTEVTETEPVLTETIESETQVLPVVKEEIVQDVEPRFELVTQDVSEYVWDNFGEVSLSRLRTVAKTLRIPRYSRMERSDLVREINERRKAAHDDFRPENLAFIG